MSATGAQINVSGVTFAAAPLKRITTAGFSLGGGLLKFRGDVDIYPSIIALVNMDPSITLGGADIGTFAALVPGTVGAFVMSFVDAKAQTGGNVVLTAANAVFETADVSAAHAAWGAVTASWQLYASDGITPPLVLTRV